MQQVCPTCRAEIPADGPVVQVQRPSATQAAPQQQVQAAATPSTASQPNAAVASSPQQAATSSTQVQPTLPAASLPPTVAVPHSHHHCAASSSSLPAVPAPLLLPAAGTQLPPLQDLVEMLKRAEDVAKFLREQQDFWLQQVRQIQSSEAAQGGLLGPAVTSAVQRSANAVNRASHQEGTAFSEEATVARTDDSEDANQLRRRAGASSGVSINTVPEGEEGATSPSNALADLRRARQEAWERTRSGLSKSNDDDDNSVNDASRNSSPSKTL